MIIDGHNVASTGTTALGGAALAFNNGALGNLFGTRQAAASTPYYRCGFRLCS